MSRWRARPAVAQASSQPWSNATIDLNGLNYVDAQARISAASLNIGEARFAPAAIETTLASGVLKTQISNLGAYDGNANGDLTIDASTATPAFTLRADLTGVRALPLLKSLADFDKLDGKMQTKINVRSAGNSQRAIMTNLQGTDIRRVPGRRHQGPQRRPDDPLADVEHAVGMAGGR